MSVIFKNHNPIETLFKRGNLSEFIMACEGGLIDLVVKTDVVSNYWKFTKSSTFYREKEEREVENYITNFCKKEYQDNSYLLSINQNKKESLESYIDNLDILEKLLLYLYKKGLDPWKNNAALIKSISLPSNYKDDVFFRNNSAISFFINDRPKDDLLNDKNTNLLFHYAAAADNFFLVDLLVEKGFSFDEVDEDKETAIFKSASSKMVRRLYKVGFDIYGNKEKEGFVESVLKDKTLEIKKAFFDIIKDLPEFSETESLDMFYLKRLSDLIHSPGARKEDFISIFSELSENSRENCVKYIDSDKYNDSKTEIKTDIFIHSLFLLSKKFVVSSGGSFGKQNLSYLYNTFLFLKDNINNFRNQVYIKGVVDSKPFEIKTDAVGLAVNCFNVVIKQEGSKTYKKFLKQTVFDYKNWIPSGCLTKSSFDDNIDFFYQTFNSKTLKEENFIKFLEKAYVLKKIYVEKTLIDKKELYSEIFEYYLKIIDSILLLDNSLKNEEASFFSRKRIKDFNFFNSKQSEQFKVLYSEESNYLDDEIFSFISKNGSKQEKRKLLLLTKKIICKYFKEFETDIKLGLSRTGRVNESFFDYVNKKTDLFKGTDILKENPDLLNSIHNETKEFVNKNPEIEDVDMPSWISMIEKAALENQLNCSGSKKKRSVQKL